MAVTISGMFGGGRTFFADSPVVITVQGLEWPTKNGVPTSPFNIVRIHVLYNGRKVGDFHADTGGQSSIEFDISSALRAIWSDFDFDGEVAVANAAYGGSGGVTPSRGYRDYSIVVYTEYIDSDGEFRTTDSGALDGGQCLMGGWTEYERATISNADVSGLVGTNPAYGDASTKPHSTDSAPERVGRNSIVCEAGVNSGGTQTTFHTANESSDALRDTAQEYTDFLIVNRRGAMETCSALTLESMDIASETKRYGRVNRPAFRPKRSLMNVSQSGPRRSWPMSSGHLTREWLEWWAMEFLPARRHWMLYKGRYVPVTIEAAKKSTGIYDRAKQQLGSVEFTVTMALEG